MIKTWSDPTIMVGPRVTLGIIIQGKLDNYLLSYKYKTNSPISVTIHNTAIIILYNDSLQFV